MNLDDDLPEEIVQPLAQLGRILLRHARTHHDGSLADHEEGVLWAWRTAAPTLLEAVLQLATTGPENNARPIAGAHAVSSGAVCSRDVRVRFRRGWVRFA